MSHATLNAVELSVFSHRIAAICEEMGAILQRSAFSPNIKDRLDFSCAIFDVNGELSAQAAHIPVHLGSMAYAMAGIVNECSWVDGDMVVVNDPYLGGTHLPDVTIIAPVFVGGQLVAFIANRAHHANIGASSPGSMPLSTSLEQEGVIIPPTNLCLQGDWRSNLRTIFGEDIEQGDFVAQVSANRAGVARLFSLIGDLSVERYQQSLTQLNDYGQRVAESQIEVIPNGEYQFTDYMDDDGAGCFDIAIKVTVTIEAKHVMVDFSGTADQVQGNINCPLSVAAAAVFYVFRCLMPANTPACAGVFRSIQLTAPEGCLVNARRPAAVAAGNVETSTRITDVVLGALAQAIPERIPAASHGSMNNVAMGAVASADHPRWDYYETIGGGMGAGASTPGLSAVQTHMTNTLNTPVESLEMHYPLRVTAYQLNRESGGGGVNKGGDGIIREFEFLRAATATLLTERRRLPPWGSAGGKAGKSGRNTLNESIVAGKCELELATGDRLKITSPGGGGWGNG